MSATPPVRLVPRLCGDVVAVVGRRYLLFLTLMTITGLMEAVTLASVVPLLASLGVGTGVNTGGTLTRGALLVLARAGVAPGPFSLGAAVVAALLASTLLFLLQAYEGARLQTLYVCRWQQRLARAIFHARWSYLRSRRGGDLVNAMVTETQRLGGAFYQLGLVLTGIVHSVLFLAMAAMLSGATTALLVGGAAALFAATRPLVKRAYQLGEGITRENATLQSLAGELVSGAKLVKATASEDTAVGALSGAADRLRRHVLANAFDVQVIKGVFDFGAATIGAALLVISGGLLHSDPAVTLVVLAIFVRLMPKLTGIQQASQSLTFSLPAFEVTHALVADAERAADPVSAEALPSALREGPLTISLERVHVCYGEVEALRGVDLEVAPGSCVAIAGASGSGKSTLVDAIVGLAPLSRGTLRINGVLLPALPLGPLRRRVGYMGQESVLHNASIRENILWGQSGVDAAALDESARLAGAYEFIERMTRGYDTPVGDRGMFLSGGERQRVALARAALGAPGLLILDEATNALDAETERTVVAALAGLRGRTTVLLIAHRLSSLRHADMICVMDDGRLVERGSWDELIRLGGRFAHLWELQHERDSHVGA